MWNVDAIHELLVAPLLTMDRLFSFILSTLHNAWSNMVVWLVVPDDGPGMEMEVNACSG